MSILLRSGMILGFLLSFGALMAQGGPRGERMTTEEKVAKLTVDLSLDSEQSEKILAIEKFYDEKRKALRESIEDRDIMRKEMIGMQESKTSEITALLSSDQQELYGTMLAEQKRSRPAKGGRKGGKRGGQN